MKLTLLGHDDRYAVEQLQLALFPEGTEGEAVSSLHRGKIWLTATAKITMDGQTAHASRRLKAAEETVRLRRQMLQQAYYLAAIQLLPSLPAWGALAGVRPTKITTKHMLEGGTTKSADKLLKDVYYVTPERRKLAIDCSISTVNAANLLEKDDISLYVGIPFCPTRCTYCSFVSRTIGRKTELLNPYLEALLKELEITGKLLAESGKQVRTIYIGGGTPTTLTSPQMANLLDAVQDSFDLSRCMEFTVEGDLTPRSAKVYASDSRVDENTRTFTVRALYDNKDGKLVPGRYVSVNLTTREYENALAVPSEAIVSEMGIDKVYLCRGGKAEPVEITKGLRTDALVQVLRGLCVGDTVITSGTMQLRAGQRVSVSVNGKRKTGNGKLESDNEG